MQGDTVKAKNAYQDFLAMWKDADADIPILIATGIETVERDGCSADQTRQKKWSELSATCSKLPNFCLDSISEMQILEALSKWVYTKNADAGRGTWQ